MLVWKQTITSVGRYCNDRFLATGFGSESVIPPTAVRGIQSTRGTFENTPGFAFGNSVFRRWFDSNNADANLVSTDSAT